MSVQVTREILHEIRNVEVKQPAHVLCSEGQYEAPGSLAAGSHRHCQCPQLLIYLLLQLLHVCMWHLGEEHQFLLRVGHSAEFSGGEIQMCVPVYLHGRLFVFALDNNQLSYLTADLVNLMLL